MPRVPALGKASGFHKKKTVRNLTHAFTLGGVLPPPPVAGNWFWREKGQKPLYDSFGASKAQSYTQKNLIP